MQNLQLFNYYTSCQIIHSFHFIPKKPELTFIYCGGFHTLKGPVRICRFASLRRKGCCEVAKRHDFWMLIGIPSLKLTASLPLKINALKLKFPMWEFSR